MTSLITRTIILIIGYAYPAFECFKIVEKNRPEIEQLIFWCQYWIIIAALTVLERVLDTFVSWLPMYSEAKLAFILYLWYPKTKGTSYVYESFVRPFVAKHEVDIDRNIHELKTRAGDIVLLYGRKSSSYVQAKLFDVLQYVATQSSRAHPVQNVQQSRPPAGLRQAAPSAPPAPSAPSAPSAPPAGSGQAGSAGTAAPTAPPALPVVSHHAGPSLSSRQPHPSTISRKPSASANSQPTGGEVSEPLQGPKQPTPAASGTSMFSSTSESTEEMEVDSVEAQKEQNAPREQSMDSFLRMTRSRLKQTRKLD